MKRAFTFAELMISLVIIAIITVLLYPTIADLAPNNNKHLFKSAYRTVESVIADITANGTSLAELDPDADANLGTATDLCEEFAQRLNWQNGNNCTADQRITNTTNGMIWFFNKSGNNFDIYVDVNPRNNSKANNSCTYLRGLNGLVTGNGNGCFMGNDVIQDTFKITVTPEGKITPQDPTAIRHLTDASDD